MPYMIRFNLYSNFSSPQNPQLILIEMTRRPNKKIVNNHLEIKFIPISHHHRIHKLLLIGMTRRSNKKIINYQLVIKYIVRISYGY
jgi:hypothetical protein